MLKFWTFINVRNLIMYNLINYSLLSFEQIVGTFDLEMVVGTWMIILDKQIIGY